MYVLIAGGGKIGANLARSLLRDGHGHEVTLIEQRRDRYERLEHEFEHQVQMGDATEIHVLDRAGIEDADAVVVATNGDNTNLVIAQVAQKRFDNQCVVVRVLDPARADFYKTLGLRTICPTQTAIETLMDAVRACEIPVKAPVVSS